MPTHRGGAASIRPSGSDRLRSSRSTRRPVEREPRGAVVQRETDPAGGRPACAADGLRFPLANAIIQRAEQSVGRRAGVLYLSNTVGAVCGSLAAGFLLLPALGHPGQRHGPDRRSRRSRWCLLYLLATRDRTADGVGTADASLALGARRGVGARAVAAAAVRLRHHPGPAPVSAAGRALVASSEGLTEVIAVTEVRGQGRRCSPTAIRCPRPGRCRSATCARSRTFRSSRSTNPRDRSRDRLRRRQHDARRDAPSFGPARRGGGSLQRHPGARRLLQRTSTSDVLSDPRVVVYVNDGRQHLQMQPPASYDLITLEPPPIAYAGVAALYSREFYALARTRLKAGRLHQPVAAGLPGAGGDDAGDDSRVRRRLPAGGAALGR